MKPRVIIYAVCMLLTGSINTIATKWQDMTIYQGVPFQHPAFQSAAMFLGESLCLIPYFLLRWRRRQIKAQLGLAADPVKAARPRSYYVRRTLAFLVPTLCDAIATTLLNLGLFYTYASTYQMLRGTLVLFAGILTVTILRRRLYSHHWVGLVLIVAGAAIVGAASLLAAPEEGSAAVAPGPHPPAMEAGTASQPLLSGLTARGLLGSAQGGEGLHLGLLRLRHALLAGGQQGYSAAGNTAPLFGDALVVLAQGFAALQFILEEKFLGTYRMQPLLAVGIEGAWGVLLCLGALPLLTYVKLPNGRPLDDASAAFQALAHQPGLRAAVAVSVLSIGVFNFFGLSVTAALSGSARATIDATRTLFIWLFSLAAGWESFHELQVVGFAVLLAGSSLYNEILRSCLPVRRALPKPGDPEWGPDSDDEEEGAVTEALLDAQGLVGPALPPSLQPEGLAPSLAPRAMQSTRLRWKSGGCMLRQSLAHPRWIEGGSPGFQCQAIGTHRSTPYNPLAHRRSRHELTHLTPASLTSTAAVCTAPPNSVEVEYESVIGIEAHVQLLTRTKAFCNCASSYGEEPNTSICPICMGHPGTLPVPNQEAVKLAIRAGFALGCHIAQCSKFDRKQYFYADLPKGYQISQFDEPICTGGQVLVDMSDGTTKRFGITRAHLEEDSGKTVYGGSDRLAGSDYALCDFNRAGVPLLEIVSEPDMRSGRDAYMYGDELRRVLRFCGVSDGNMAEGSMRCDVNISVRPKGQAQFGTKVEIKNMNSFSNMQKAIDYEYERQVALLRAGREAEVVQETRLWDEFKLVTYSMRRKEGNVDYRYFPEPDLPPLVVSDELLREVQASMPELPAARRRRYSQLGLPMADVLQLAEEPVIARMFDGVLATGVAPKLAANWIVGDIQAYCKEKKCSMDALQLTPAALAEMIQLIDTGVISGRIAKDILPDLLQGKGNAGVRAYVEGRGMLMITDQAVVAAMVDKVLSASPKQLAEYRAGKVKLMAFFEGQLMKESRGRVDPRVMKAVLVDKLSAPA